MNIEFYNNCCTLFVIFWKVFNKKYTFDTASWRKAGMKLTNSMCKMIYFSMPLSMSDQLKRGWHMVDTWLNLKHNWSMVDTWLTHGWHIVDIWLVQVWIYGNFYRSFTIVHILLDKFWVILSLDPLLSILQIANKIFNMVLWYAIQ